MYQSLDYCRRFHLSGQFAINWVNKIYRSTISKSITTQDFTTHCWGFFFLFTTVKITSSPGFCMEKNNFFFKSWQNRISDHLAHACKVASTLIIPHQTEIRHNLTPHMGDRSLCTWVGPHFGFVFKRHDWYSLISLLSSSFPIFSILFPCWKVNIRLSKR